MSRKLEKVYDFDQADLLLNQTGQLSERQIRLISEYERIQRFGSRISFVWMFVSTCLITFIPLFAIGIEYLKKYPPMFFSYLAVFSIMWLLLIAGTIWGKLSSDIKSRKISMIEGFAEHKTKKHRQWQAYFVTVGTIKFQVETAARYKAFQPNVKYRVFYIKYPPTHIVLSVAEIPE